MAKVPRKKKQAGPVLVGSDPESQTTPFDSEIGQNGDRSQEKTAAPQSLAGEPDHSLVPVAPRRLLPPEQFFRFWQSIPVRERNAWFIAYVYRKFPICDVLQPLSEEDLRAIQRKAKKAPETNCGKVTEPLDPAKWEQEVYARWGAGDYQIRLNDTHPSVRGTVTEAHIMGLRNFDNFPPIVKVEEVVQAEPLNQPYLRWARLRGIRFPGDPGYDGVKETHEETEDMALQATVEKLTDRVIEMSETQHRAPAVDTNTGEARAAEVVANAAMHGQKIMTDALAAATATQAKAADPAEHTRSVIEMAKLVAQPAGGPSLTEMVSLMTTMMAPLVAANQAILEESRARAAAAERRAELLEQRLMQQQSPSAASTSPEVANPVKNAIDLLKGLASLRDTAGSVLGGETGAGEADMPVWARLGMKALDVVPGMLHNAAVLRTGQGQPVAPEELNPALLEAETRTQTAPPIEPVQVEDESVLTDKRIAQEIAAPLIKALNEGRKGFEFAAGMMAQGRIMGFPGRVVYEMAVEQGENGMIRILQCYPELWNQLVRIPQQFGKFLAEFLDRNAAYQVLEQVQAETRVAAATAGAGDGASANVPANGRVEAVPVATVMPPVKPKGGGRTVVNPADGKPIHTAPVVDTTAL